MPSHWRMSLLCSNWAHQPVSLDKLVSVSLLWIQLSLLLCLHISPPPPSFSLCAISPPFSSLHFTKCYIASWYYYRCGCFCTTMLVTFLVLEVADEERQVLISFSLLSHFVSFAYLTLSCSLSSVFLLISYPFSSHLLPVFLFSSSTTPPRPLASPLLSSRVSSSMLFYFSPPLWSFVSFLLFSFNLPTPTVNFVISVPFPPHFLYLSFSVLFISLWLLRMCHSTIHLRIRKFRSVSRSWNRRCREELRLWWHWSSTTSSISPMSVRTHTHMSTQAHKIVLLHSVWHKNLPYTSRCQA